MSSNPAGSTRWHQSSNPFRRADSDRGEVIKSNIMFMYAAYVVTHNLWRLDSSVSAFVVEVNL